MQSSEATPVRNILIVNVHSAQNAGDAALVQMNVSQLRAVFPQAAFVISANYPDEDFYQQLPGVRVIPSAFALVGAMRSRPVPLQILALMWGTFLALLCTLLPGRAETWLPVGKWGELFRTYRQVDLVAAVSGNQFLSMGRYGWPFPLVSFGPALAHLFGKPLYVLPQSIGPFKRGWERVLLKWIYGRARKVYLRDNVSMDLAREIGLPARTVSFAPDPAFGLPACSLEQARNTLSRYGYQPGKKALGVTVIAPIARTLDEKSVDQYYQDMAVVLDRFARTYHTHIYIFSQVTGPTAREDDRRAGREVLSRLPRDQQAVSLVEETLSPGMLKACYGCMDLFIASRLHSGIFSTGAGVPTLFIGYFTKTRGLLQAMGLEDWLLELGKMDSVQLWEKLTQAWENRLEIAAETRARAAEFAAANPQTARGIYEDYYHAHR